MENYTLALTIVCRSGSSLSLWVCSIFKIIWQLLCCLFRASKRNGFQSNLRPLDLPQNRVYFFYIIKNYERRSISLSQVLSLLLPYESNILFRAEYVGLSQPYIRIGDFWVAFCLCFRAGPSAKPFIWKSVLFTCKFWFIYMWIKLISIWKALHYKDSLWNRGEGELWNHLLPCEEFVIIK